MAGANLTTGAMAGAGIDNRYYDRCRNLPWVLWQVHELMTGAQIDHRCYDRCKFDHRCYDR